MDDKKNVGFIPGLALILSALALVLIAINAVKPTPTVEILEQSMDKKIEALNNSILAQVKNGNVVNHNVATKLFERDLVNLEISLAGFETIANPDLAPDLAALKQALAAIKGKMVKPEAEQAL